MSTAAEASSLFAVEYGRLSRQQKLAIFLIAIGPEGAAEVLKHFDDTAVEALCREMAQFTLVPDSLRNQALEELVPIIGESAGASLGGADYARRTLVRACGETKADVLLGRVGGVSGDVTTDLIRELGGMESRQIYNLLRNEQPQTTAFLLSHLAPTKVREVFLLLTPEVRQEVAECLGTIDSTAVDLVAKFVRRLGRQIETRPRPVLYQGGGVQAVADLLNGLDKETSKALLAQLAERNAELGTAVRKKMFSFEDLGRLSPPDLQRVLREVESASLATSMKSASEAIRKKIYASISKRAAESLREEIDMLGAVRLKEVEAAQDAVIQVVRRLEDEGAISLDGEGEGVVN